MSTTEIPEFEPVQQTDDGEGGSSRRAFLKGTAATGLAALGAGMIGGSSALAAPSTQQKIVDILTVARTAEQLAVTFYLRGVENAKRLGLSGEKLNHIEAALIEEQIHLRFFAASGGKSLANTFSFPKGSKTFTDLETFIETQQQLEGVFDSAFLAAVKEFSDIGQSRLAQISAQVACIESEHRALGREILNRKPADNWAFAPVLVKKVADAPALVAEAGYLSPRNGNRYPYRPISYTDPRWVDVFRNIQFRTPIMVGE